MKKGSLVLILIGLIYFIIIFHSRVGQKKFVENINKSPQLGLAIILDVNKVYKRATAVELKFYTLDGDLIYGESGTLSFSDNYYNLIRKKVIGKTFPIIYNNKKPNEFYQILLDEGDFKAFDMDYPDSMRKYFR